MNDEQLDALMAEVEKATREMLANYKKYLAQTERIIHCLKRTVFWLTWTLVALSLLVVLNLVRELVRIHS